MTTFKDRNKTRIQVNAITSCYAFNEVNSMIGHGGSWPALALTVGSCPLKLIYDKKEDRDSDLQFLDNNTRKGST